jgi:RNA polymerase sigma-70 factor (ECF subfamily)
MADSRTTGATELVDHLFRHMAGQMQSTLVRVFGTENIGLAEDVVQETLIKAFETWQYTGLPENPQAWLQRVARNRAIDILRHEKSVRARAIDQFLQEHDHAGVDPLFDVADPFGDDQLTMMFLCCHPALSQEAQLALTLRIVAGLGICEIAKAFLLSEETVAQRIVRAKRKIRDDGLCLEMPEDDELLARLDHVLTVLYLLFNEGYSASSGDYLIRSDLCEEAIRLARLLADRFGLQEPKIHALLALMHLQASRLGARVDSAGSPLLLAYQDRREWDQNHVSAGVSELKLAMESRELSTYHLQAAIASCHALAPSYEETDWAAVCSYYDALIQIDPTPVGELNRAIAIAMAEGPHAGIDALDKLRRDQHLCRYHLLPATLGELYERAGDRERARQFYSEAIALTTNETEIRFLESKRASCR